MIFDSFFNGVVNVLGLVGEVKPYGYMATQVLRKN